MKGKGKRYTAGELAKAWILSRFSPIVSELPDTVKFMDDDEAVMMFNRLFSGDDMDSAQAERQAQALAEAMANASIARGYLESSKDALVEMLEIRNEVPPARVAVSVMVLPPPVEVKAEVEEAVNAEPLLDLGQEVLKLKEILGKLNKRSLQTGIKFFWFDDVLKNQTSFVVHKLRLSLEEKLDKWKATEPAKRRLSMEDVHSIRGAGWKRLV